LKGRISPSENSDADSLLEKSERGIDEALDEFGLPVIREVPSQLAGSS